MPKLPRSIFTVALALTFHSAPVLAGVILERTVQLDLGALALPTSRLDVLAPLDMITLDVGDRFVFHLQFVGGRLAIEDTISNNWDVLAINFNSNPVGQTGFLFNGNWKLEGVEGDLLANDINFGYGGPIGGSVTNTNLTDSAFSISGVTFTVDVVAKELGRPAFTSDEFEFVALVSGQPTDSITWQSVPEPSTFALAGLALFGVAGVRRR